MIEIEQGVRALAAGDAPGAAACFETALARRPDDPAALMGRAAAASAMNDAVGARQWGHRAVMAHSITRPEGGPAGPLVAVVGCARGYTVHFRNGTFVANGGNGTTYFEFLRRQPDIGALTLFADCLEPHADLPPFQVIANTVAEPDAIASLGHVQAFVDRHPGIPVINPPRLVARCTRDFNAARLRGIDGLVVPRTLRMQFTDAVGLRAAMAAYGLTFPVILRRVSTQTGETMVLLADEQALRHLDPAPYADAEIYLTQFVDGTDGDGVFRKYRLVAIGDGFVPLHALSCRHWDVHLATADEQTRTVPAFRALCRRFLAAPQNILSPRAIAALGEVAVRSGLEVIGIDFTLLPDGRVLFFEANPAMDFLKNTKATLDLAPEAQIPARMDQAFARMLHRVLPGRDPAPHS